jgi:hypothetical protein
MKLQIAFVLMGTMMVGCGTSHALSPASPKAARALAFTRMDAGERLIALRPTSLPKGTKIYRPRLVLIETPATVFSAYPTDIVSSTSEDLAVRINGHIEHFPPKTTHVTYDAQVQEIYVPPGIPVPANAGTLVDTVR